MKLPIAAFAFLLGLVVGSFINVVIRRGERGEKLTGRSHCESCGKTLSFSELIPVLSFLIQKGRCRSCGSGFSWQYLVVELGTGISYALAAWFFPDLSPDSASFLLGLAAFLGIGAAVVIAVNDIRSHIIPNGAVLILFLIGVYQTLYQASPGIFVPGFAWYKLMYDVNAAIGVSLFLALLWFFSEGRWMGFGDVKLIFATSLILGFPLSFIAFLMAFWTGGLFGIILLISRQKTPQSHIPFGPFILLGATLTYFLPPDIVYPAFWYW